MHFQRFRTVFDFARLASLLGVLCTVNPALAADGVREISQAGVDASGGFPFTIDQGGSWILTSDLVVPNANTTAIEIAAENVTLDLQGFSIRGPGGVGTGGGVVLSPNNGTIGPVTLRNGIIRSMGDRGVYFVGNQLRVEGLTVSENGGTGIFVGDAIVAGNIARSNGEFGIRCGSNCVVRDNLSSLNGDDGIRGRGLADGNTSTNNTGDGIEWSPGGLVIGNAALNNTVIGIRMGAGAGFQNNVASGNAGGQIAGGIDMGNNVP